MAVNRPGRHRRAQLHVAGNEVAKRILAVANHPMDDRRVQWTVWQSILLASFFKDWELRVR